MIETIHSHTLHPRYLNARSNVLDLGANIGQFSKAIVERFDCRCVAVEPAPSVFSLIPDDPRIMKIQAAVSTANGPVQLHLTKKHDGNSILANKADIVETIEVDSITLPTLLARLGWTHIDLLKIDIEGAEIALLESCPAEYLRKIAQITVEFHDFCELTPAVDVLRVLKRLSDLGFYSIRMSRYAHQDTWLINRAVLPISRSELIFTKYAIRNIHGAMRVTRRQFGLPAVPLTRA